MPSTQIEFDHRNETLNRVIDRGHRKKRFGMCHEAMQSIQSVPSQVIVGPAPDKLRKGRTYLVMRSSIDLGSRIKVGRTTRLKSAPGRSCEMICERTVLPMLVGVHRGGSGWSFSNGWRARYHFPARARQSRPLHYRGSRPRMTGLELRERLPCWCLVGE